MIFVYLVDMYYWIMDMCCVVDVIGQIGDYFGWVFILFKWFCCYKLIVNYCGVNCFLVRVGKDIFFCCGVWCNGICCVGVMGCQQ